MEDALGFECGYLDMKVLMRIDVPNPKGLGLRLPSGNEVQKYFICLRVPEI